MKKYTQTMMTFKEFLMFIYPFLINENPSFNLNYMSQFSLDFNKHSDKLPDDLEGMMSYFKSIGKKHATKCLPSLYKTYMERTIDVPDKEVTANGESL